MKRKILYATGFILMAVSLNSCEGLFESCKICKQVTYFNGNVTNESEETEYCGLELSALERIQPSDDGSGRLIKYECR